MGLNVLALEPLATLLEAPGDSEPTRIPARVGEAEIDQIHSAIQVFNSWISTYGSGTARETITGQRRYRAAIAAGVDPAAVVEAINEAQAQRAAAQAELEGAPAPNELTGAEVYAMIDSLGDVGAALTDARPETLSRLYQDLGLELRYEPHDRAVVATASPRVVSARVRGGSRTHVRDIPAQSRYSRQIIAACGGAVLADHERVVSVNMSLSNEVSLWPRAGAASRRG